MSNFAGISAVTEALRATLNRAKGLSGSVTADPLTKFVGAPGHVRLNLHLYQILPNAHWRNMEIPWKGQTGQNTRPPLALDLRYLLSARADSEADAQKDLGRGMLKLHDDPMLDPVGATAPFERARITMQPLSLDDMEKLWAGVSTPRLLSVAYEVSVVLIESELPTRAALPVLSRGTGNDSITVQTQPYPALERIEIGDTTFDRWLRSDSRPGRNAAQIDDEIYLYGQALAPDATAIVRSLMHPFTPASEDIVLRAPLSGTNDRGGWIVDLGQLDFDAAGFPAGPCSVALEIRNRNGQIEMTNAIPFSLAPTIRPIAPNTAFSVPRDVVIDFRPPLVKGQTAALIVGSSQFVAATAPGAGDRQLTFALKDLKPGDYPIRLRVDGVDSVVVDLDRNLPSTSRPTFSNVVTVEEAGP